MSESLDNKFLEEIKEKFIGSEKGETEHLSIYFLSQNAANFFKVHVSTDDYKTNCVSKSLGGVSAFKLADEASVYLIRKKYSCTLDMKNLPKEIKEKCSVGG